MPCILSAMASDTKTTGRDSDKFMLRFPEGMRDRITESAKAAGRSMNAEIVARLDASFSPSAPDAWAEVVRIEAEYSAAGMFLSGVKQQLEEAHAELEQAKSSGAAKNITAARQSMVDLLVPLEQSAFNEWLVLGDRLRIAKHQAMGIKPKGSPTDAVARRLFGPEWDDMSSLPSQAAPEPGAAPSPERQPARKTKGRK